MTTQSLVAQIRALNESIAAFDKQIAKIFQQHEDYGIFDSFPGCGEQLGPRLLATFGEDRERFDSAEQIQKMTGIAPVTKISGKTHYVQWRWACPRFIRRYSRICQSITPLVPMGRSLLQDADRTGQDAP